MKRTILVAAFLVISSCAFADEIEVSPAGNTIPAHEADPRNLVNLDLHNSLPIPDLSYLGLGFEHAFGRFTSLRADVDFQTWQDRNSSTPDPAYSVKDLGVSLEALLYPFGRAPRGLFVGGYSRLYQREFLGDQASSIRLGGIVGYNWRLFKGLTLGVQAALALENVLSDPKASSGINNYLWYDGLIWERNTPGGRIYFWYTLGWMF